MSVVFAGEVTVEGGPETTVSIAGSVASDVTGDVTGVVCAGVVVAFAASDVVDAGEVSAFDDDEQPAINKPVRTKRCTVRVIRG